jgi:sulfur dioxygenase
MYFGDRPMTFFRQLFDRSSCTYTYFLADKDSGQALIIDPVREHFQRDSALLKEWNLQPKYILETHIHADHVTSAGIFRKRYGTQTVLSSSAGSDCAEVQLEDGDFLTMGEVSLEGRHTPGHTNGCIIYIDHQKERVFTGDTLFIRGCGRTDFQQGSAKNLYHSVHQKIFSLPPHFLIYPGHDYKGRLHSTVQEEMTHNPRLKTENNLATFERIMGNLNLSYPQKIKEALPANLECGLPKPPKDWPVQYVNGIPQIPSTFAKSCLQNRDQKIQLMDCREESEWLEGHLEQAKWAPLSNLNSYFQKFNKESPVFVYCKKGGRSLKATALLQEQGFSVYSIEGGYVQLQQQ